MMEMYCIHLGVFLQILFFNAGIPCWNFHQTFLFASCENFFKTLPKKLLSFLKNKFLPSKTNWVSMSTRKKNWAQKYHSDKLLKVLYWMVQWTIWIRNVDREDWIVNFIFRYFKITFFLFLAVDVKYFKVDNLIEFWREWDGNVCLYRITLHAAAFCNLHDMWWCYFGFANHIKEYVSNSFN